MEGFGMKDDEIGSAEYMSADLDPTLIDMLEEVDDTTRPVGVVVPYEKAAAPVYAVESLESKAKRHGRYGILLVVMIMLIALIGGYIWLGAVHINTVDDVVKLLGPVQSIVATALGATVAFYFSDQKH
jgi:hypothetical protein